jgi:hypothetical protein
MASLTPKLLYLGAPGIGSNAYTSNAVANSYTIIKNINICNTTSANKTCNIHLLRPTDAIATDNNKIISNMTVLANNTTFYNTAIVMPANTVLYCNAANTTIAISGVEYIA